VTPANSAAARAAAKAAALARPDTSDDDKEILVIQALDDLTTLKIEEKPITEAIRLFSESTGVPVAFDRFVLGCLPYGSKTVITATIQNQPLRESLMALLKPLACKFVQERAKLVIQPRPALFRIGRRATWEEVGLIERLYATPWSKALGDSLKFQFQDMSAADAAANRQKIYQLAGSVGAGFAARVLDLSCDQYGWAWHPEKDTITICTKLRQVELQMQRLVSVQYSGVQLKDVLLDLAQRAGLLLKMEPGVLVSLPSQQLERYRLTLENVTVRQAFELVAGETGLGYVIEADGIRITPSTTSPPALTAESGTTISTKSANPVVGTVPIPGMPGGEWFVREQDLPAGVNRARIEYLKKVGEKLLAISSRPAEEVHAGAR
jgi:hypothetical protein